MEYVKNVNFATNTLEKETKFYEIGLKKWKFTHILIVCGKGGVNNVN